jgi:arylsulfate sulfotransferase
MTNRKIFIHGLISCLILSGIFTGGFLLREEPQPVIEPIPLSQNRERTYRRILKLIDMMEQQQAVDEQILSEFAAGQYTVENPLVVVNPYTIAPLTALVLFKSAIPVQVTIHIEGKDDDVDVDYTYESFETQHILPIYGLYASSTNTVVITTTDQNNQSVSTTLSLTTEPLLPQLTTNRFLVTSTGLPMSPGFTFSYQNGYGSADKTAIDRNGDYRWILAGSFDATTNFNNGHSVFTATGNRQDDVFFLEFNYLGRLMNVYHGPYGIHHEIEVTEQELLLAGNKNVPNTVEDFIYAIDRQDGTLTKTISYLSILDRTRNEGLYYSNQDWMHMNSITPIGSDIIVSSNFQSAVIRNSWDGQIKWILADPIGFTAKYQPLLLKPIGKDFLYSYNQHSVEVLPDTDNNPDTLDILLFDNGSSRNFVNKELMRQIAAHEIVAPPLFSRMVHYQIDEKAMTVRQIWSYGEDRPEIYAATRGDADLLPNGNVLGTFFSNFTKNQIQTQRAAYVEVNAQKQLVWEAIATSTNDLNAYIEYRAERFEIYNAGTARVVLGEPTRSFIPQSLINEAISSGVQP